MIPTTLTEYIAVYGASLSTFVFLWNISNSRSKITISIIDGYVSSGGDLERGIYIDIKNPSPHTIHISSINLLYPYRHTPICERLKFAFKYRRFRFVNWVNTYQVFDDVKTGLPKSIDARNSHSIFVPEANIRKMLKNGNTNTIAACVQDALWRIKYSPIFKVSLPVQKKELT